MDFSFADDRLDRLYTDAAFTMGLPPSVVTAFRKRMQGIRAANDERDFYNNRSWRFEKLKGKRQGQCSIRLNDQFRLIVELEGKGEVRLVRIVEIADYH